MQCLQNNDNAYLNIKQLFDDCQSKQESSTRTTTSDYIIVNNDTVLRISVNYLKLNTFNIYLL